LCLVVLIAQFAKIKVRKKKERSNKTTRRRCRYV
jgi:hypothetical protein